MARKKRTKKSNNAQDLGYNLSEIIFNYASLVVPLLDDTATKDMEAEELMGLLNDAVYLCSNAWNLAMLPPDCGEIVLQAVRMTLEEDEDPGSAISLESALQEMANSMKEIYPDGDVVIVDHEIGEEGGGIALELEAVPLEEAIMGIRASK